MGYKGQADDIDLGPEEVDSSTTRIVEGGTPVGDSGTEVIAALGIHTFAALTTRRGIYIQNDGLGGCRVHIGTAIGGGAIGPNLAPASGAGVGDGGSMSIAGGTGIVEVYSAAGTTINWMRLG